MAEGDDPSKFKEKEVSASDDSDLEESPRVDLLHSTTDKTSVPTSSNDPHTTRRDENPFSFKHFLRSDKSHYHRQGARPKVYCEGRPTMPDVDLNNKQARVGPELSSALPDFVQDHLVIEQCYLGNSVSNNYNLDVNNLPDFAPGRNHNSRRELNSTNSINIPLDLPVRPQAEFPLDLPIAESQAGSRSCPATEVGNSKSLPDFLADGAVRPQNEIINTQSPEREVDRCRQELELVRRQLNEQIRRADYLSRELKVARNKEHEYTQNLAKALEQVEENLERSNIRAASSENTILKLRHEVKTLTAEVHILQHENRTLRGEEGASGGPIYGTSNEVYMQRFAQELRLAANTAEHSLRQLLTGVEDLRMLASSVENRRHVEECTDTYQSDVEEDSGPAL